MTTSEKHHAVGEGKSEVAELARQIIGKTEFALLLTGDALKGQREGSCDKTQQVTLDGFDCARTRYSSSTASRNRANSRALRSTHDFPSLANSPTHFTGIRSR
jgi:hypothetical protein